MGVLSKLTIVLSAVVGVNSLSRDLHKNVRRDMGTDKIVEIKHSDLDQDVSDLLHLHGADHFGSDDDVAHFKLSPEAMRDLKSLDVRVTDFTEEWISEHERKLQTNGFICDTETTDCANLPADEYYATYQPLESLHARATALAASVDFAEISSIGQSYEGRNQLTVNIGDQSKPLVFYFCGIHSREWLAPAFCMYMVENLIANGGHPLLETFAFTVLISANPDGYVFSQVSNSMWRKTRKPNPGSSCVGVDPNRNYELWHCGPGTSNDPCSDSYCGPEPWTEIEVANIRDFGLANADRMVAMADIHAYSKLWMSPYAGIASNPTEPDFSKQMKCSQAAVDAIQAVSGSRTKWKFGPIHSTIYPAGGSSVDWFYDVIGTMYPYAAELRGTSFQPKVSEIMPSNKEVFAAMEDSLKCVAETEGFALKETTFELPKKTCKYLFC